MDKGHDDRTSLCECHSKSMSEIHLREHQMTVEWERDTETVQETRVWRNAEKDIWMQACRHARQCEKNVKWVDGRDGQGGGQI